MPWFALVLGLLVLLFLARAYASLRRSIEVARGRSQCAFCGARLKKVGPVYANACRKCGRVQPWAEKPVR